MYMQLMFLGTCNTFQVILHAVPCPITYNIPTGLRTFCQRGSLTQVHAHWVVHI